MLPTPILRFRPFALPVCLLMLMECYTRTLGRNSDSLAPPSEAILSFSKALLSRGDSSVLLATAFTLSSAGLGLLLGGTCGVLLGIVLGLSRRAAAMSFVTIEVLRPVPSVALIPLAMLTFGFGYRMEISVVAFATFWPLLILTKAAVEQVEPRLLEVSRALNMSVSSRTFKIVLPAILPRLFVALRLGVSIALVVSVTVEIAANPSGMGYALMLAQQTLQPSLMLAWLFWIGVVGYGVNAVTLHLQRWVSKKMGETAGDLTQ